MYYKTIFIILCIVIFSGCGQTGQMRAMDTYQHKRYIVKIPEVGTYFCEVSAPDGDTINFKNCGYCQANLECFNEIDIAITNQRNVVIIDRGVKE